MVARTEFGPTGEVLLVEEIPGTPSPGLDADGKLATALAVLSLLPVEDAANLVGLPAQALVDEALAWGVASQL